MTDSHVPRQRAWLVGVAALTVVQVGGSVLAARGQPDREGIDAVAAALLLVAPLALVVLRRWPLVAMATTSVATIAFIGSGYPYGPVFAGMAATTFVAIQDGRRRGVIMLAPLILVGFQIAEAINGRSDLSPLLHGLVVGGWVVAVIAVSEIVRARREQRAAREHAERGAREQRLADQRIRLAQELHDVLAHNISLINVQASTALHLSATQPERSSEALANIKRVSAEALGELRTALDLLRQGDSPRVPAPRIADLPALVDGVRASGLNVRLEAVDVPDDLASPIELVAFRVVQEALTNVTRHSHAQTAVVRVAGSPSAIEIDVVDDGRGPVADPSASTGSGLIGMRARVESLGGTFEAAPGDGSGFRVHARLPLPGHD